MMFVHRLLLSNTLNLVSKKPLKLIKQINVSQQQQEQFTTDNTALSSFKDIQNDPINISLFNIKRSMKLANVQFEDGFTNLKTSCPVCDPNSTPKDVFINKTTGNVIAKHRIILMA